MVKPCLKTSLQIFALLVIFSKSLFSEQVGIFKSITPFNSSDTVKVFVPNGVVALSGNVPVVGDSTSATKNSTSLFFMVDHSGSMAFEGIDPELNRMKLISNIIDTLAAYPDKFPEIECGLSLFGSNLYYDQSNDSLLTNLPGDTLGMYLPLVDLVKEYSESGNKTGSDIIKDLLEIGITSITKIPKTGVVGAWWLADYTNHFSYNPGNGIQWFHDSTLDYIDTSFGFTPTAHTNWVAGTKIDYGFKAAVEALKKSTNPKENQFIIFFSDGTGDATDIDYQDGFMNGKDDPIPTTFTIFFTTDGNAPDLLVNMEDSIKTNGFSSSNMEHTSLVAYKNTTIEALVSYVMDSIITIFESSTTTKPNKITINGDSSTLWNSSEGYFTFTHPIALTGLNTNISMILDLTIVKDSIAPNDSVIQTTIDTMYTVITNTFVDSALLEEDANGTIEWWERDLSVASNGVILDSLTELNSSLSALFNFDSLESSYKYSNIEISAKCKVSKDSITFNCDKVNDTLFEKMFQLDPIGNVSFIDNVLTPDSVDELILTFRNSENYQLPLDTLEKRFPYHRATDFIITSGSLYDDNSNGYCDKIVLTFEGDTLLFSQGLNEIISKLNLPISRGITVDSSKLTGNELSIFVTVSESINTGENSDDTLIIKKSEVVSTGGVLRTCTVPLVDKMAPVCASASLRKSPQSLYDTLLVIFSENIDSIEALEPFVIISKQGYEFTTELRDFTVQSNRHIFSINKGASDSIGENDSLYINIISLVDDTIGNIQIDSLNNRVPIIIDINGIDINISSLVFLDPLGKGYPGKVNVSFSMNVEENIYSSIDSILTFYLENLINRELEVDSIKWDSSIASFFLTEKGKNFNTAVLNSDKILINSSITLSEMYELAAIGYTPIDSMAPVCIEATLYDNPLLIEDSISITFSENIDSIYSDSSFVFHDTYQTSYSLSLSQLFKSGKTYGFTINDNMGSAIKDGDSINIKPDNTVLDTKLNYQNTAGNKKVPVEIIRRGIGINFGPLVFFDPLGKGYPSEVNIKSEYILTDNMGKVFESIFKNYLENINDRSLLVDSTRWNETTCIFYLSQPLDGIIKTSILESDKCIISDTIHLSENVWIDAKAVDPIDSMAPVLTSAILVDSLSTDSISHLIMAFSEIIEDPGSFTNETPYLFKSLGNIFPVDLSMMSLGSNYLNTFPTKDLQSSYWDNIDSVRIHPAFGISDGITAQRANENRLVKLEKMKIAPPLELELKTTMITNDNPESHIIVYPINKLSLNDNDIINGTITIIDHVGNIIIQDRLLEYDKANKKAMLKWNGKNDAGRKVGSGIYPLFAIIDPIEKGNITGDFNNSTLISKQEIKGTVGVKY